MKMTVDEIKSLLASQGEEAQALLNKGLQTKLQTLDNCVHLRGLIEYSSLCAKNCLYCGLRCTNASAVRYTMSDQEVFDCAQLAILLQPDNDLPNQLVPQTPSTAAI